MRGLMAEIERLAAERDIAVMTMETPSRDVYAAFGQDGEWAVIVPRSQWGSMRGASLILAGMSELVEGHAA